MRTAVKPAVNRYIYAVNGKHPDQLSQLECGRVSKLSLSNSRIVREVTIAATSGIQIRWDPRRWRSHRLFKSDQKIVSRSSFNPVDKFPAPPLLLQ